MVHPEDRDDDEAQREAEQQLALGLHVIERAPAVARELRHVLEQRQDQQRHRDRDHRILEGLQPLGREQRTAHLDRGALRIVLCSAHSRMLAYRPGSGQGAAHRGPGAARRHRGGAPQNRLVR
jgi:hypothetical protein